MTPPSAIEQRTLSPGINIALSAVGGCLDAFTYVGHGRIFANTMTGNLVLLAVNAAGRQWHQAFHHVPPIITFVIGVAFVRALTLPRFRMLLPDRALIVLAIEIVAFFSLSWLAADSYNFLIVTTICLVASLQTAAFRQINQAAYNSTFATGNLRTFSESLFDWIFKSRHPETQEQVRNFAALCTAFFAGALFGGLLTPLLHNKTLLFPCALLSALLIQLTIARSLLPQAESSGSPPTSSPLVPPERSGQYP